MQNLLEYLLSRSGGDLRNLRSVNSNSNTCNTSYSEILNLIAAKILVFLFAKQDLGEGRVHMQVLTSKKYMRRISSIESCWLADALQMHLIFTGCLYESFKSSAQYSTNTFKYTSSPVLASPERKREQVKPDLKIVERAKQHIYI